MPELRNTKPEEVQCVESVYKLSTDDFPKKVLHPLSSETKGDFIAGTEYKVFQGKTGNVTAKTRYYSDKDISYAVNLNTNPIRLKISFTRDVKGDKFTLCQEISLKTQELTFGTRWHFTCPWCGHESNALFLIKQNPSYERIILESSL